MDRVELPPDFLEFLRLSDENDVDFLLVGGYAVAHHGYPRATQDLDDLKVNKRAAGRAKDLDDLENLP